MEKQLVKNLPFLQDIVSFAPVNMIKTFITTIVDNRFCQVYICGDGVVTSDSSAMATFLCDDPDATFKCKLNGKKIHPCTYAYVC